MKHKPTPTPPNKDRAVLISRTVVDGPALLVDVHVENVREWDQWRWWLTHGDVNCCDGHETRQGAVDHGRDLVTAEAWS